MARIASMPASPYNRLNSCCLIGLRPTPCSASGATAHRNHGIAERQDGLASPANVPDVLRMTFGCTLPSEMCPHTARSRPRSSNRRRHTAIISSNRSYGTIMSAAVLEMAGSACFASATRRLTPAGTASRISANAAARARSPGRVISASSNTPCRSSSRQNLVTGESCAAGSSESAITGQTSVAARLADNSEIDRQDHRRSDGQRDVEPPVDAVFAQDLDRARIEMLDGRDVNAVGIVRGPRVDCRTTQFGDERNALRLGRHRHERAAKAARHRRGPQRDVRDDAERALGADEEIDEIHSRLNEVTGGFFGHVGHPQCGKADGPHAAGRFNFERAIL